MKVTWMSEGTAPETKSIPVVTADYNHIISKAIVGKEEDWKTYIEHNSVVGEWNGAGNGATSSALYENDRRAGDEGSEERNYHSIATQGILHCRPAILFRKSSQVIQSSMIFINSFQWRANSNRADLHPRWTYQGIEANGAEDGNETRYE